MAEFRIGEHMYKVMDRKEYKRILYQPGRVTRIILNRPRYANALSHPLLAELEHAFDRAAADPECRVIVLSGAGRSFSSGDDTIGLTPESPPMMADERTPEQLMKDYGSEHVVWDYFQDEHFWVVQALNGKLREIPKPTIAMVHGYCIFRAWLLAQAMDIIFAAEDSLFLPISYGTGLWDMGARKALEIAYEHRFLTAHELLEYHFVNRVYPTFEVLEKETLAYAERVAEKPLSSLRGTKENIQHWQDIQGFAAAYTGHIRKQLAYGGGAASPMRAEPKPEERHRERYEGRGMARAPVALAALKATLEGQGKEVPNSVLEAIARGAVRDDRGAWERALHQGWREKATIARAEANAKAYDEAMRAKEGKRKA